MPTYVFFDLDLSLLKNYKKCLDKLPSTLLDHFEVILEPTDVRQLSVDVYVSPANSYGWMDGGIDGIYSKMFIGIQSFVQKAIAANYPKNFAQRACLPVGNALLIDLGPIGHNGRYLVCAPTMTVPQSLLNNPTNVYKAMLAILKVCAHLPDDVKIGIPGLGTGVGGLDGITSGQEILRACLDFHSK